MGELVFGRDREKFWTTPAKTDWLLHSRREHAILGFLPAALVGSSIGIPQLLSSNRAFKELVKRFAFAFHYLV